MSGMVARVARAIDEAFSQQSDREDRHYDVPIGWTTAAAIAAIEAVRAMIDEALTK